MTETNIVDLDETVELPLASLFIDDANVRAGSIEDDPDLDALAASIGSLGLLQPLVVVKRAKRYGVVAGRRRFLAILKLTNQSDLAMAKRKGTVAVRIIDEATATEASLAENYARKQMSRRETYTAFLALQREGKDAATIGEAFGYDEQRTQRILRLASLAEPIRNKWFNGDMSDDKARAFGATDDHEIQLAVFEEMGHYGASAIRRAILERVSGTVADSKMLDLVGLDTYVKAGGKVVTDLFSNEVGIADATLLTKLYHAKVKEMVDAVALTDSEGEPIAFRWLGDDERPPETEGSYGWASSAPLRVEVEEQPLPHNAAKIDALEAELDSLNETEAEDDEAADAMAERAGEIHKEIDKLQAEGSVRVAVTFSGTEEVLVAQHHFNWKGELAVTFYYPTREAAGLPPYVESVDADSTRADSFAPRSTDHDYDEIDPIAEKKAEGLSKHGFNATQELFADAVALRLAKEAETSFASMPNAQLGLAAFLFGVVRNLTVRSPKSIGVPQTHTPERGALGSKAGRTDLEVDWLPESVFPWAYMEDTIEAWDTYIKFATNGGACLNMLGARLLGATWSPLQNQWSEQRKPMFVRLVAETAVPYEDRGCVWADENVERVIAAVRLMSHKARKELLASWGVGADVIKTLKKDDSAPFVESVITSPEKRKLLGLDEESEAEVLAWVPQQLEVKAVTRPPQPEPEPVVEPEAAPTKKPRAKKVKDAAEAELEKA